MTPPPASLSIVITGRNDNYGGDFTERFLRTLRFNLERLAERRVPHEVVLVEWAPPADRPRLIDLVRDAIPALAPAVRAYLVDARYQEACSLNPRLAYLEYMAKNVGIRRARHEFVLATNTDIYLGRGVVDALTQSTLKAGTIYRTVRLDVRLGTDESRVDWAMLEDERNQHPRRRLKPPLYSGASGDFTLTDRATFHALRGYNEVYRLARLGVDVNFLAKAYASGYPIVDLGAAVYHTNHVGSFQLSKSSTSAAAADRAWGQRWPARTVIYENPEGWGLGAAPAREDGDGITHLDFDWAAVPPLVALRRLVLPPARTGQLAATADDGDLS